MRKLVVLILWFFGSIALLGQTTAVTATITDSDSTVWINPQWSVQFVPNPNFPQLSSYSIGGVPITSNTYSQYIQVSGTGNGSGVISTTLLDNSQVLPAGSTYRFVVQSQTSAPATTFTPIKITGASQSLSTALSIAAIPPRFPAIPAAFGYVDAEVSVIPQPGGGYYNVVTSLQRIWNGTTWTNGGSTSSGIVSSIFNIASNCNGVSNCLAWVDDDTTDNCGTATTAFFSALNAYAGAGNAYLYIQGSGTGIGYKLTTCNLPLTGPSGLAGPASNISVISNATIDCAQTGGNCIQMGKTGCPTTTFYSTGCHDVTWRGGTILGCVSLATACIEVEQGMFINVIDDVTFNNTGAGNATIGSCTNYSVQWDTWIGGQEFSRNKFYGTVKGQCFSINNDTTGGANTIIFTNNVISHLSGVNVCGSQAHYDASSHSIISNNTIYGFASTLTLAANAAPSGVFSQAGGWMITNNNFDYSLGCNGAVNAEIQFSGSRPVGPATVTNNNVQSKPFISRASGSTATLTGWVITGNNTYDSSLVNLLDGTSTTCSSFGTNANYGCYLGANPGFSQNLLPTGTPYSGWITLEGNNGHLYSGTLSANQSSTAINGSVSVLAATYAVSCQTILTRAASTSSVLPSCVISWTDLLTSTAETATVAATNTTNTIGTQASGIVYVTTSGNINVSTAGYTSVGGTSMQYSTFSDITRIF